MKLFKIFIFSVLLILIVWVVVFKKADPCSTRAEALYITPNGEVTDAIVNLLGLTGIRISEDPLKGGKDWPEPRLTIKSRRLEDVVPAVQGKLDPSMTWLGNPTKERWEKDPQKPTLTTSQAIKITDICGNDLKKKEKTYPQKAPKAVLFLGAALSSVRMRLVYLNELYDLKKLSPDLPVYIITGERKLDEAVGETQINLMDPDNGIIPFRKDWVASQGFISDEGEMIKLVFSQSRHTDLDEKKIIAVYSPKEQGHRATTESTIKYWLKEYSPSAGNYVAISNQPYNFYQESVIRRVLLQAGRPDICVEVVGPEMKLKAESDEAVIEQAQNLLNNLSRVLYELEKIRNTKPSIGR